MKYRIYLLHTCWSIIFGCLEFKFRNLNSICLVPFPKSLKSQNLNPISLHPFPFLAQPSSSPAATAAARSRRGPAPRSPPAALASPPSAAQQAAGPTPPAARLPPAPADTDRWGPPVIPHLWSSPSRTRAGSPTAPRRPRVARTPRASSRPGYLRPPPPPGPPTRATRAASCPSRASPEP
jgi:hypothetical protein